jgi:Zn2+/Cd2+-exporting ATPase
MIIESNFVPLHIVFPAKERDRLLEVLFRILAEKKYFDHMHAMHKEGVAGMCVHYNSAVIKNAEMLDIIKQACAKIVSGYKQQSIKVYGMHGDDCAERIEKKLAALNGVYNITVSFTKGRLFIEYDSDSLELAVIWGALKALGYSGKKQHKSMLMLLDNKQLVFSIIAGFALLIACYSSYVIMNDFVSNIFLGVAYVLGLIPMLKHSVRAVLSLRINVSLLMLLAAIGAGFLGKWFEGSLLLFLFGLGHGLEHMAMDKAKDAVKTLTKIVPKYASLKQGDVIQKKLVSELVVGDIVVIKAGEMVPCDGVVLSGNSAVDQAAITGESMPLDKTVNDDVFAGTINGNGILHVEVMKLTADSTLSKMINIIVSADAEKSQAQHFTEKFAKIFVPTILFIVLMIMLVPPLVFGLSWYDSLYKAIICLVAASPCALAIGTPAAVLSAVARSAKMGAIVKGGVQLERLAMVTAIAIDKTGTLTTGEPVVQSIIPFADISENDILQVAASVEQSCFHPLARAIVHRAQQQSVVLDLVHDAVEIFGKGMAGFIAGKQVVVGSVLLLPNMSAQLKKRYDEIQNQGLTTVLVAKDGKALGVITISDDIRHNAHRFIGKITKCGVAEVIMLTGDNLSVATKVASELGIKKVVASLLPENKVAEIIRLKAQHNGKVAMLGDGVNDAPAMSSALVGIAMGGAGSDVALDVADIVLMQDDLALLPEIIALSKRTAWIIKQNIFAALSSIVFLVAAAIFGAINLASAVFIHESMSVLVVLNGLRMLRFKAKL